MDQYIYNFWEDPFMNLEKGRKQMEDMTRWIMGGLGDFEERSESFGKFWDMNFWSTETQDYMKAWETTTEDFQKLFKYYLDMMGLVPKDEHFELINQYKVLNERVADQVIEISKQKEIVADQKQMITDQKKEIVKQKKLVADQRDRKSSLKTLKKRLADRKMRSLNRKILLPTRKKNLPDRKKSLVSLKKK